jgi:hypothetical protein
MTDVDAAWTILRRALPHGWRAREPTYDPAARVWSVWAVPPPPLRILPVRGGAATEAAAIVDLAAKLAGRFGAGGSAVE